MSIQDTNYAIMSRSLVSSALIHFIEQGTKLTFVSCLALQTWKVVHGHADVVNKNHHAINQPLTLGPPPAPVQLQSELIRDLIQLKKISMISMHRQGCS